MSVVETLTSVLVWYLTVSAAGVLVYPLVFATCTALPDRGISIYRAAGIAIVPLPLWILGNVFGIPFAAWVVILSGALIGLPAWWLAIRRGDLIEYLRQNARRAIWFEVGTLALFVGYIVFRGFNPDISGTEKPMELAFLNASIHAGQIPVTDPWFAGETINYYYFGYVALATISLVSGIPGEIAFNLGLAATFALATVAAAGLSANLSGLLPGATAMRAAASAILGGFLLAASANLHAAAELVRNPSDTLRAGWWDGIGWSSSRVVEDSGFSNEGVRTVITEFPAFSFILGDLHPHVIALPWLITGFSLFVNLFLSARSRHSWSSIALVAAPAGVALGVLYSANTWDVPLIFGLTMAGLLFALRANRWTVVATGAGAAVATALVVAAPFAFRYSSPAGTATPELSTPWNLFPGMEQMIATLGYVSWDRTSASALIILYGSLLVLTLIVLVSRLSGQTTVSERRSWISLAGSLGLLLLTLLAGTPALVLLGVPALLLGTLFLRRAAPPGEIAASVLLVAALAMLVAVEFVFVRDPFGDRMNTVFKLSFQAWAAFSIALGALVPDALARLRPKTAPHLQSVAIGAVCATLLASAAYAPISAYRWSSEFQAWRGIDGIGYLDRAQPADRAGIEWIRQNAGPDDVVLEAAGCAYGSDNLIPHNRVSMATGRPTVIGWDGHQFQWRRGQTDRLGEIGERIERVRQIYENPGQARAIIDDLQVEYVFIGSHETNGYSQCGHGPPYEIPDKESLTDASWQLVFEQADTTIWRVTANTSPN